MNQWATHHHHKEKFVLTSGSMGTVDSLLWVLVDNVGVMETIAGVCGHSMVDIAAVGDSHHIHHNSFDQLMLFAGDEVVQVVVAFPG